MSDKKVIVVFEAGRGLTIQELNSMAALVRQQVNLPDSELRFIPAIDWDAVGGFHEDDLDSPQLKQNLLQKQLAYMESRRWGFNNQAVIGAFRDMAASSLLQSLFFIYVFDRQKLEQAELKAGRLFIRWVPAFKYRAPAWVLAGIAFLIAAVPVTLSFLFPDVLGAAWAILDLLALGAAGWLFWRGVFKRLRKYPITSRQTCGGCGRRNRFIDVVIFNCEKCSQELAYELAKDRDERALRVRQVKCPHCMGINDLRYRRSIYACRRCGIKQPAARTL